MRTVKKRLAQGAAAALASAAGLMPLSAVAHHVMDSKLPATIMEGLLSGLGHPVIGLDHLAFVIALGLVAAIVPGPFAVIAAFVAFSVAGVMVHLTELDVPMIEPLVALTVLLIGAALVWSRSVTRPVWIALAAVAGVLHGYAFGESIVGAERTVLGAYLIGIALVTALIATLAMGVARKLPAPQLRMAGAALGCVGAVFLAVALIAG